MENMPQKSQSVGEKLQAFKLEKELIMQKLQEKSARIDDLWIQQRSAETQEEKERIIKDAQEESNRLEDDPEYQELHKKRHRLLYDIAYLERQELVGVYYFTQSLLQDIENTFIELPTNDPRIEECLERMEEIQELLKKDEIHLQNEGVTQNDFDNYGK